MQFRKLTLSFFLITLGCILSLGTSHAAPDERKTPPAQPAVKAPDARKAPVTRPVARPIVRPAVRPVVRPAARPVPRVVVKPVARPAARPVARPAVRPVARPAVRVVPVVRKEPVKRAVAPRVVPVVRRVVQPPARPIARPVVVRRPAPVVRRAPVVRPAVVARRAPVPRPVAPVRKLTSTSMHTYAMSFRGDSVGSFTRTEKKFSDQTHEVKNVSKMNIKMLFTTVQATNTSDCVYDKDNRLTSFTITSIVRGKTTSFKGKRDTKGMTITKEQAGKKKTQFFPEGSFQGTSLDFRFPPAPPGVEIRRHYLVIPRMNIVEQVLVFRQAADREVFGRIQPVLEITIKNSRGHGTVLVTKQGLMVASRMHGRLGVVEIKLK